MQENLIVANDIGGRSVFNFSFSLEGLDKLLSVFCEYLIKIKDWLFKKCSNTIYYFSTQRPQRKLLYNNTLELTGTQICVMRWILSNPARTVGQSISYGLNNDLLECFILLEGKKLIHLDHSRKISGVWTELSVFFEYPESDPNIIRKALGNKNVLMPNSTDPCCEEIFQRLNTI
jgi:hypothetical protein